MESSVNIEFGLNLEVLPMSLLIRVKEIAYEEGIRRIALIGGAVRDSLLSKYHNHHWGGLKDVDLIVEGSATQLAEALQREFEASRISKLHIHKAYNTVEITIDGISIDLATARLEKYEVLAENPKVTPSSIEEDLARRDFTINSIAIDLSSLSLIDPNNGLTDLVEKKLNFIHNHSVEEDPTRIIRAARYSARLDFALSPDAIHQIKTTLKRWPWQWLHTTSPELAPSALGVRLRSETELLLTNEPWELALEYLQDWGALLLFDEGLQNDHRWQQRLLWASKLGVKPLTALIAGAEDSCALGNRLKLGEDQQRLLRDSLKLNTYLSSIKRTQDRLNWTASRWSNELEKPNWKPEAVLISICLGIENWEYLLRWWDVWRKIKPDISAHKLIEDGWDPGPKLGAELQRLREEMIDLEEE